MSEHLELFISKSSWDKARIKCEQVAGTKLVKIDSFERGKLITRGIKEHSASEVKWFWIGLRRRKDEAFHWPDQTKLGFTAWGVEEPSTGQCVEVRPSAGWRVASCDQQWDYTCEKGK